MRWTGRRGQAPHTVCQFMRVLPFRSDKDIGVVHGDIKPQNVLVFKDAITRKIIVKVADFGYSTLTVGESGKVFLPKSRPWNAPEHHFRNFKVHEAKNMDVYSFGMLCLWFLFRSRLQDIPQTTADGRLRRFRSMFTCLVALHYLNF